MTQEVEFFGNCKNRTTVVVFKKQKQILYIKADKKKRAQRGARTHDRWIKSPTLYRLS